MKRARDYAGKEALKATYQDRNKVSDSVVKIANDLGVVGEAILPFKRTPANILVRAAEYSPIGVAKSIYDGAAKVKTGDKSIGEVIDEAAAGLTGSGLLALGAYMFASGMVTGAQGDDKDDKWAELLGASGLCPGAFGRHLHYPGLAGPGVASLLHGRGADERRRREWPGCGKRVERPQGDGKPHAGAIHAAKRQRSDRERAVRRGSPAVRHDPICHRVLLLPGGAHTGRPD